MTYSTFNYVSYIHGGIHKATEGARQIHLLRNRDESSCQAEGSETQKWR